MIFSKKLRKFQNLKHCFFSRQNGISDGLYESLNCGLGSNDKKENILKNLEFVGNQIGCKKENLITLNQKHSNEVIYFQDRTKVKDKIPGDAMITQNKNIAMGYVPFEGNLNNNGFPIGNFGKKYKVHLPKKYSTKPVNAVVVPIPFTESFHANTREVK